MYIRQHPTMLKTSVNKFPHFIVDKVHNNVYYLSQQSHERKCHMFAFSFENSYMIMPGYWTIYTNSLISVYEFSNRTHI